MPRSGVPPQGTTSHNTPAPAPSSNSRRGVLAGAVAVAAISYAAYRWYRAGVITVPGGTVCIVFNRDRRVVLEILPNTSRDGKRSVEVWPSATRWLSSSADHVLLPRALLALPGETAPDGCPLSIVVPNVAVGPALLTLRVEVVFFVRHDELDRYLALHGRAHPHGPIGTCVATAALEAVQDIGSDDPELYYTASRRTRSVDPVLSRTVSEQLWVTVGVRCRTVYIAQVSEPEQT